MDRVPIVVVTLRHGPPPAWAHSSRFEIITEAPGAEEFVTLGEGGALIHHVSSRRSYLGKVSPVPLDFSTRAAERVFELQTLWNRQIDGAVDLDGSASVLRRLQPRLPVLTSGEPSTGAQRPAWPPVETVELVCCTYNRTEEPLAALKSLLGEARAATNAGIPTTVNLVYQNDWFPERLAQLRPQWRNEPRLRLTLSAAGLPRARNVGVAASTADLIVFVDDDVELDAGFVSAHAAAANAHPTAVGIVGRIRSRIVGAQRRNQALSVGQVRVSGWVDDNFDSLGRAGVTVVPQSPRGANMAFRRDAMNQHLGHHWFDESLTGSAHREETTLGVDLFRRGLHLVYAPEASLLHLEAEVGGCENRGALSPRQRIAHAALDYLFLNRLYAPAKALRAWAPLLTLVREIRHTRGMREKVTTGWIQARAFRRGLQMHAERSAGAR